jgi:hypothetical protein
MNIETLPSPDGEYFQHSLTGYADSEPNLAFSEALADLERLESGDSYPMVIVAPDADRWVVEVSLWSPNTVPSAEEAASLQGTLIEVVASSRTKI